MLYCSICACVHLDFRGFHCSAAFAVLCVISYVYIQYIYKYKRTYQSRETRTYHVHKDIVQITDCYMCTHVRRRLNRYCVPTTGWCTHASPDAARKAEKRRKKLNNRERGKEHRSDKLWNLRWLSQIPIQIREKNVFSLSIWCSRNTV